MEMRVTYVFFFVTGIKDFVIFTLQPKKLKMERQAKMLIKKIALLIKPSSETVATPSSSFFHSFFVCLSIGEYVLVTRT